MAKRVRNNKEVSIEKILDVAFLFYATKPYDKVVFEEMAKSTDITSGGIFYHFKSKQALFEQMCNKFLLEETSMFLKLEKYEGETFEEYIEAYINTLKEQKQKAKELGVENLNMALINITNQALFYYPEFAEKGQKWVDLQIAQWRKVIIKSMVKGEISENVDVDFVAQLFEDIYCGLSYLSIANKDGIDFCKLRESFVFLYNSLKK